MRLKSPRLWIGLLTLTGILAFAITDLTRTAPGPISASHARVPELQGLGSCHHCHGGWFGDMTSSCLECHAPIARQLADGTGLHGRLGAERAQRCGACHGEHHGEEFRIVNQLGFAIAGVPDPRTFDHELVGFPMAGMHLELACGECHLHADAFALASGQRRYLGLSQDCATCHHDPHDGRMRIECAQCHGQDGFAQLAARDHDRHLPLEGGHAGLDCRRCHAEGDPRSLEAHGAARATETDRVCADCHRSPHTPELVRGAAHRTGKPEGASCAACHLPEHTKFLGAEVGMTREQHRFAGFPLDEPHHEAKCAQCHDPARVEFAQRHPGRKADQCDACHDDAHRGEFAGKPFAAQGCVGCHERTRFAPHAFSVEKHAQTAFPLTGSHASKAECKDCHPRAVADQPATFHGTKARCDDCHRDAHAGYFGTFARELAAVPAGTCARCHQTTSFAELPREGFDHGRWTGFALEGAHAQAGCESCHERSREPDENGRCFGRIRALKGEFRGCVTCHEDPHRGEFDRGELTRTLDGRIGCERCHSQTSFRNVSQGFDHGRWTGFPLQGAHRRAECTACHQRLAEPDPVGRTWQRARGTQCADCHQDPHAGQFVVDGRTECRRCHHTADAFKELVFRHDIHSRFKLGEQHEGLACAACHKPFRHGTADVIRYRPLPTECVDCHGQVDTPFLNRKVRRR
ncbi:MAG: hypothetical protein IT458_20595 [Planctomycetes bacterium]|nr:hypothetical protein [Planctomycetota bacterium]